MDFLFLMLYYAMCAGVVACKASNSTISSSNRIPIDPTFYLEPQTGFPGRLDVNSTCMVLLRYLCFQAKGDYHGAINAPETYVLPPPWDGVVIKVTPKDDQLPRAYVMWALVEGLDILLLHGHRPTKFQIWCRHQSFGWLQFSRRLTSQETLPHSRNQSQSISNLGADIELDDPNISVSVTWPRSYVPIPLSHSISAIVECVLVIPLISPRLTDTVYGAGERSETYRTAFFATMHELDFTRLRAITAIWLYAQNIAARGGAPQKLEAQVLRNNRLIGVLTSL